MTWERHEDRHRRACEMLGHALTLGDELWVWNGLSLVIGARLTAAEQRRLLGALLVAMNPDDSLDVVEVSLRPMLAGAPLPALDRIEEDARWWAGVATLAELRAYLAASFRRLPERDQRAFLSSATRRMAA